MDAVQGFFENGYNVAWLGWAIMFAVIELPAALNNRGNDTLTDRLWTLFAVRDKPPGWKLRRGGWFTFLLFLGGHLAGFY